MKRYMFVVKSHTVVCREETGFSSLEEGMTHLQATVPRDKLIDGARAMSQFTELFKAHIVKAASEHPADSKEAFVVTKDVVDDFVSQLRSNSAPLS